MLLLNILKPQREFDTRFISIHLMLLLNLWSIVMAIVCLYFNTSYVVIKRVLKHTGWYSLKNFNTSYVVIKLKPICSAFGIED